MAKGHKGKKRMISERTRKLSKTEQAMVDSGMATIKPSGHLDIIDFEPTEEVLIAMKRSEQIRKNEIGLLELKVKARKEQALRNKERKILKMKNKKELYEINKLKKQAA